MRGAARFLLTFVTVVAWLGLLPVQAFETRAGSAYVFDVTTQTVLLEKQAHVPLPPASMSKLMTLNMLFEALADGRVQMDTRLSVSERAQAMGGSTMFLNTSDRPTVEELIQGIIVMSGNDACVVVAEALGGTEDAFARMMTERAHDIGMLNSSFGNASGWPDPRQRMSMHDLALLATRLITEFPDYYHFFSIREYAFDGRAPDNRHNRNPLLALGIGADGLKTGHTQEAGYGLVGSARQGNRRIVFVIAGLESQKARAEEAEAIVNWAFRQFALRKVLDKGERLAQAEVWLGESDRVGLISPEELTLLVPAGQRDGIEAEISWNGPLEAPVSAGQPVAEMVIHLQNLPDRKVTLVTEADVAEAGFRPRLMVALGKAVAKAMELTGSGAPDAPATAPLTN